MLPIPMIIKSSIIPPSNSKYWLDSSNDDFLFNKAINGQSLIFSTSGTSEEPTYGNQTINSVSRRTFRARVLTSDSTNANIQVFDQSPFFQGSEGFTIIRIKNTVPNSLQPTISPHPEFVIQTGSVADINTLGHIKNIYIEPFRTQTLGAGIQISRIIQNNLGNYLVASRRWEIGACFPSTPNWGSSEFNDSRLFIDIIKITPNFGGGFPADNIPNVEWIREVKLSTGNVVSCESVLTTSNGFYSNGTAATNIFSPTRVWRNANNAVSTNVNELECLVFNEVLNQQSIDNIVTYLKNKWSF